MKLFVAIAAAAALFGSAAIAEQNPRPMPVKLYAAFSDLNPDTPEGVDRLASRIRDRIEAICGTRHQALMRYVSSAVVAMDLRRDCIESVDISPRTPAIEAALVKAKTLAR